LERDVHDPVVAKSRIRIAAADAGNVLRKFLLQADGAGRIDRLTVHE
jgi:hypothetical protein